MRLVTFRMKLAKFDHFVTGCARVLSAFLWLVAYCFPAVSSLSVGLHVFTPEASLKWGPLASLGNSFRQKPGPEILLKRQRLVVPTDSPPRLMALLADVSNRLCIGRGTPQKQNLPVSPWKSARTIEQRRVLKIWRCSSYLVSIGHGNQLVIFLRNFVWIWTQEMTHGQPPKPGWPDMSEWNHQKFWHELAFLLCFLLLGNEYLSFLFWIIT